MRGILAGVLTVAMSTMSSVTLIQSANAADEYPAALVAHALLPAKTFISAPADAPDDLKVSGKYTTGKYVAKTGSIEGKSSGRPTGVQLPFQGQPVQGHSGIKHMADGTYWILTDNGFGSKANSSDAMLFIRQYRLNWDKGTFEPIKTIFFHDQDQFIPHRIINQDTKRRYLTGSDFDPESFQIIDGDIWVGEEFGPWLLRFDNTGKLKTMYDTKVEGNVIRSPDHPSLQLPSKPDDSLPIFNAKRSKGFEGMASAPNGRYLYPLLEGALYDQNSQKVEAIDGKHYLRILQFDTERDTYTDMSWKYILDSNENAIGDFNMIDETYGLVIERDNLEGTSDKACSKISEDKTQCFDKPAVFKRIYKVRLDPKNQIAEKIAYIDLMAIKDPNVVSRTALVNNQFVFPFFTIENVDIVDDRHIVVGNDNNLPFSSSRNPNQADDNELALLEVTAFLQAK
jgi:hypothetical protein